MPRILKWPSRAQSGTFLFLQQCTLLKCLQQGSPMHHSSTRNFFALLTTVHLSQCVNGKKKEKCWCHLTAFNSRNKWSARHRRGSMTLDREAQAWKLRAQPFYRPFVPHFAEKLTMEKQSSPLKHGVSIVRQNKKQLSGCTSKSMRSSTLHEFKVNPRHLSGITR